MLLFIWLLAHVPKPTDRDELDRTERVPMNRRDRRDYLGTMAWGIAGLVLAYMLLTAVRDYRDKFAVEILDAVGANDAAHLATSEIPVTVIILVVLAAVMYVRKHKQAIVLIHLMIMSGLLLAAGSTYAFQQGYLDGFVWYMVVGTGLYLAYAPYNGVLFERIIAFFRQPGNAGYFIYIADAMGYLSSVGILLWKNFGENSEKPIDFFIKVTYGTAAVGVISVTVSLAYFLTRERMAEQPALEVVSASS